VRLLRHATMAPILFLFMTSIVSAQKPGGTLRVYHRDSPASMSIYEETTLSTSMPMMGVFNNLVIFDPSEAQNRLENIIPDLAESWSVSENAKDVTFKLRSGVKWHDGKPFTANDVKCSWDLLLGKGQGKLRVNARETWWTNLGDVTADSDYEATFHLKRPQPSFLALLASGLSPVYPCHVSPAEMRQHPIGTGPFKFVEFKPNQSIKVVRNPDYWKSGRPYLDGVEYTIVKDPSTANLAFIAGNFDMTFPLAGLTIPLMKNIESAAPQAICELNSGEGINRHLLVNYHTAPFDNPQIRRAMALSIDRKAFVDTIAQGEGQVGGVLQPPPGGLWGMPAEEVNKLSGYGLDVDKNRAEGRQIMQPLGYNGTNPLKIKVTTRNIPPFRDPAVLLIDQLKHVYVEGELEVVDTPQYYPRILRKDFTVALNLQTSGPDPDPILNIFYGCGASINWDGYCNPEIDELIERQSREGDPAKRKEVLWQIERKLAEDGARPILFYAKGATCRQPYVRGFTQMANSLFNGWRMEDVWLDK
jgi:peptide/nickel transport system substrate-binding protein